ncbi:MAG TPA: 5'-nucleotidase C-terminal domain-containing protein [Polyangia bacterium]|jgi:5'-nucleotidase|nr:5'-nucleotidase C-terminal domain-containing protein [Polyangia bacterium]
MAAVLVTVAYMLLALQAAQPGPTAQPAPPARTMVVSVVGTNDLHGHVEALPRFGGYLRNLRRVRGKDGGAVVLVDAGDMFQGTLASNLGEGAAVIRAYNALGYSAAAIGNHEFDFGPEGPAATPLSPSDDPRGALKARAAEARFPLLAANLTEAPANLPVAWRNVRPTAVITVGRLKVGIIGVTTTGTPRTTIAINFQGLTVTPLAAAIAAEARRLRKGDAGADLVVVIAHAGGDCRQLTDPSDVTSCDKQGEIFQVARALPTGAVDVIVAGHTHEAVAHRVAGIPVIESYSGGRAFGRVDVTFTLGDGAALRQRPRLLEAKIFAPQTICTDGPAGTGDTCGDQHYEGAPVVADQRVAAVIAPDVKRAAVLRQERLGPTVTAPLTRDRKKESPLGNLFADLMRAATPGADLAITNGGGLRSDIPSGPLTYGQLFEAYPFDNRLFTVNMTGADLRELLAQNLSRGGAIVSISGIRVSARCEGTAIVTSVVRDPGGAPIGPDEHLTIVTSDFLATGGDGLFSESVQGTGHGEGIGIRDAMVALLRARGGVIGGDQPALFDSGHPRISYPGQRPVRCAGAR